MRDQDLLETQEDTPCVVRDRGRFGERFLVEALVGSGGMGMVFRGRDLLDGQAVALKVLRRQGHNATERLLREALPGSCRRLPEEDALTAMNVDRC